MRGRAAAASNRRSGRHPRAAGIGLLVVAALVVIGGSVALAFWTASDSSNPAVAVADSLPQGNRPSSVVVGPDPNSNTVTVSFGQATTTGGVSVPAENTVLRRAPESGGAGTTVTALCSGSVTVVCTESGVPDGRWVYTDTPTFGTAWTGTASVPSAAVTVDTTGPVSSVGYPVNGVVYGANYSGVLSGTASDELSAVSSVSVAIEDTTTHQWWNGTEFVVSATPVFVAASGTTVWNLSLPALDLASTHTYAASAQATDSLGNVAHSTVVTWTFNSTQPSVAITLPVDGTPFGADWPGMLSGTVSVASGLTLEDVDLTIHDVTADAYWNGVDWQPAPVQVEAALTGAWDYALLAGDLSSTHEYTVTATATDSAANFSSTAPTHFRFDTSLPDSVITTPAQGVTYGANWSGSISGTAAATDGGVLPVGATVISIEDVGTGYFWNGTNFTTTQTPTWIPTTGSTSWSLAFPSTNLVSDHTYRIIAKTTCSMLNVGFSTPVTFDFDFTPPDVTVDYPTHGATYGTNWSGLISGMASADPDFTLTLASTQLSLRDTSTGLWWNGSSFAATSQTWTTVSTATGPWSYALAAGKLVSGHGYELIARATDTADNVTTLAPVTWTFNTTAPSSTITLPVDTTTYGNNWSNSITGTATAGTGLSVASVGLTIEDTTVSKWWTGTGWSSTPTTVTATGTGTWSYPLVLGVLTGSHDYTVTPTVTDTAANTDSSTVVSWIISTTQPIALVTYPVNATTYGGGAVVDGAWAGEIHGSASPTNGSISSVVLTIQRASDAWYWNGSDWQSGATTVPVTSGTTTWTYTFAKSHMTSGEFYSVVATATDSNANVSTSAAVSWTFDTSAPAASISSPVSGTTYGSGVGGDGGWSGTMTGSASATAGSVSSVRLTIRDTTTGLYWNGYLFSSTPSMSVAATGTTSWTYAGVNIEELTSGHSYSVSATATDSVGNATTTSAEPFAFNSTAPVVVVTAPTAATTYGANWSGTITGTATPSAGLTVVDGAPAVSIVNSAGYYFDGSGFTTTTPTWVAATGDGSWSFALTSAQLTSGQVYTVTARSTDSGGNLGYSPARLFTFNTTPPTNSIASPSSGSTYGTNWTGTLAGNAAANGTLTIPVSSASAGTLTAGSGVSIIDTTASTHYNGSSFVSGTGAYFNATTGSPSAWQYPLAGGKLVSGHSYTVTVKTIDSGTNTTTSAASTFTYDTTPPTASITSPTSGTTYGPNWTGTVTGTATPNASGSTISSVALTIADTTNSTWWNGVTWQGSTTTVNAAGTTAWTYALNASSLISGHSYSVGATATDSAGNAAASAASAFNYFVATQLVFTTQPSSATAGVALSPSVTVKVEDAAGNIAVNDNSTKVTLAVGTNPGGSTLSGGGELTVTHGVASWSSVSMNRSGTGYTLAATDTSPAGTGHPYSSATSSTFTISAGAATKVAFTTQPGGGTYSTAWSTQPVVTVQDALGNTVTGNTSSVTLAIGTNPGSGTLTCTTNPVTAVAGVATFVGCKIDKVGTGYTLTATDGSLTSATSSTFNVTAGVAAKLAFTTQTTGGTGGAAWSTQPVVTVQDASGNTVTGDTSSVTLAIGTNPGSGTLTCTTNPVTAVAGVATFAGCKIDKVGTGYTLTATDGSLTSATSSTFNVTVGAPAKVAFSNQPVTTVATTTFSAKVTVQDAGGNTVTANTSNVTIAITAGTPAAGGPGTLACSSNLTVAAVAGVASFSGCSIHITGTGYTLTATDGALTAGASSTFNITPGVATTIAFTPAPASSVVHGANFTVTASVKDTYGNVVTTNSSTSITLSRSSGGGTLTGGGAKTVVNGVATWTVSYSVAGTFKIQIQSSGLSTVTSGTITAS